MKRGLACILWRPRRSVCTWSMTRCWKPVHSLLIGLAHSSWLLRAFTIMSGLRLGMQKTCTLVSCILYSCNVIHDGEFFFSSLSCSGFLFRRVLIHWTSHTIPNDPFERSCSGQISTPSMFLVPFIPWVSRGPTQNYNDLLYSALLVLVDTSAGAKNSCLPSYNAPCWAISGSTFFGTRWSPR